MKQYTHALFDWDGCLAETIDIWLESAQDILFKEGIEASSDEIIAHLGKGGVMKYFPLAEPEVHQRDFVELARRRLSEVSLYDGAKACLQALSENMKLAIVSDCRGEIVLNGLRHNDAISYFTTLVTRGESGHLKPHPASIERAMERLGANPATTIMIGDTDKDLLAACNAGIDSILFYPSSHARLYDLTHLKACQPTYVVSSYNELLDFLS